MKKAKITGNESQAQNAKNEPGPADKLIQGPEQLGCLASSLCHIAIDIWYKMV